jgi:hypothetical protein
VRVLATASLPLATGRWFGVPQLDVRVAAGLMLVYGLSAVALAGLDMRPARDADLDCRRAS